VQIVNIRVAAIGTIPPLRIRQELSAGAESPVKGERAAWFRATGETKAKILDRARMSSGHQTTGPAVIESLESTILVPPGWAARMDADGFIILSRNSR
jgi:N-methylhydantoinase A